MKHINTVLTIVLIVAVSYLFIKDHNPSTGSKENNASADIGEKMGGQANLKIAYINSDSLVTKYDLHKELKAKLEAKASLLEADLAGKSRTFQENVAILQQQAPTLTQEQLQGHQMDLQQTQQQLQAYAEAKTRELGLEERKLDSILMVDLELVLEDVKTEFGIDYIFSYSQGSSLLQVNEAYNITDDVAERLNQMNKAKKEKQPTEEE